MAQLTSSTNHHTQSMSTRSHISIHLRTPRHICSIHHHPQKNLTNTIIVTDSKSAITAIQHTTTKLTHPLIHYILQQHTDLAPQAQPTLLWIPGHCGVQGNTQADHAAKQALSHTTTSNVPLHTTQTSTPFSDQHYTNICNICTWDNTQTHLQRIHPIIEHWHSTNLNSRPNERAITRLRIGHTYATHKHIFNNTATPQCTHSNMPLTVTHILIQCPHF